MKTINKTLFLFAIITLTFSCKKEKEEEPQIGNRPPGEFVISVSANENAALISWTAATDPDGDAVFYTLVLEEDTLISDSNELLYNAEDLDFETFYSGSVTGKDSKGLERTVAFDFETGIFPNDPPGIFSLLTPNDNAQNISFTPQLSWEESLDPDGNAVLYDVYFGTTNPPIDVIVSDLNALSHNIEIELLEQETYYWNVIAKDGLGGITSSSVHSFSTHGSVTATLLTDDPGFVDRMHHTSLVFDDKMWVIGGGPNNNGAYEDVWNSSDGINWNLATDAAEFGIRKMHASVVFDGKMWLIGGLGYSVSPGNEFNDVWYSEDGINWIMATDNAAFEPRFFHQAVVFNGKMWVYGGRNALDDFGQQQAWSSLDGVNWTLESPFIDVGGFVGSEITVFDGKLVKTGGTDDVYSSLDGINWTLEMDDVGFGAKFRHRCAVNDGKLWLVGGSNQEISASTAIPDVWFTENGSDWILASPDAGFAPVMSCTLLSYESNLYLIGGRTGSLNDTNDVYLID